MTRDECRTLYGAYWKGKGHPEISDEAIDLVLLLSRESTSGFEGTDIIGLTPILATALSTSYANGVRQGQKERDELRDTLVDLVRQLPTDERLADFNLDRAEAALADTACQQGAEAERERTDVQNPA